MAVYRVAHLNKRGTDVVVVPLHPSFEFQPLATQQQIIKQLEACAKKVGLNGIIVPVWDNGKNGLGFQAPSELNYYFSQVSMLDITGQLQYKLTCG